MSAVASATVDVHRLMLGRKDLLQEFARRGYTTGAEIGVWQGRFSEQMCRAVPNLTLLCVDPWRQYDGYRDNKNHQERLDAAYAEAERRLQPFRCILFRMLSVVAAHDVADGSLDFVYLDGNHARSFVLDDLVAWTPKVRRGGIVAGHDYAESLRKPQIQVKAAVDAFTAERGISPVYVLAGDKSPSFYWDVA